MIKPIIGIIDYGAGNYHSLKHIITRLGYKNRLVSCNEDLSGINIVFIPGVGAFSSAMQSLNRVQMDQYIRELVLKGVPIIGICLGMQLLADVSYEHSYNRGLGLIPGIVRPIMQPSWHIGWNTLEVVSKDKSISGSDGKYFYFNHSFEFKTAKEYIIGITRVNSRTIVSIVKKDNIYGFQFHPEISQIAGVQLLDKSIKALVCA